MCIIYDIYIYIFIRSPYLAVVDDFNPPHKQIYTIALYITPI